VPFDQIILQDLAADYARQVGLLAFTGTGSGANTNSVVNGLSNATIGTTVTWTQASPTAALFYSQAAKLVQGFLSARLANPTCWVMSPRRWYWLVSSVDTAGRPLVVPSGPAFNQIANYDGPQAMGLVGSMHGIPVYIDPQVPTNLGTGTNQDVVYLLKQDDLILFESGPRAESFRETYADSVGVLFRLYAYVGTMLNRHSESIGVISGTGLVAPTFPG
jgi:HK97 family phage major capsid protein